MMNTEPVVYLRPYAPDDVPRLFEAVIESRDDLAPWMPWAHPGYSIDEARSWVEAQIENFAERKEFDFVITSRGERMLGGCGLNFIDHANRRANLGYWVRSSAAGRGVAVAAVRQLVDWAFENTELNRLEVVAAVGNVRSQRVAERAGAAREGVARARVMLHGTPHDAIIYAFVRT